MDPDEVEPLPKTFSSFSGMCGLPKLNLAPARGMFLIDELPPAKFELARFGDGFSARCVWYRRLTAEYLG
jgi:hypothetical protein